MDVKLPFEKTPKNLAIVALVLFVTFAPYIYFTVVGANAVEAAANKKSLQTHAATACAHAAEHGGGMSLGMWNLLFGSLNLGMIGAAILVVLGMLICAATGNVVACSFEVILIALAVLFIAGVTVFNTVWPFYGTYLLTRDGVESQCKEDTPVIYWSTIVGVVFAFLLIISNVATAVAFKR